MAVDFWSVGSMGWVDVHFLNHILFDLTIAGVTFIRMKTELLFSGQAGQMQTDVFYFGLTGSIDSLSKFVSNA
jgi:hypothetical protein